MHINISIELRHPTRRSIVLTAAAALLFTPAVVFASHQFTDVPTGHPFHAEIGAIAKAGITAGFPDGGYHPSDPVTRQAMAAFMQRGFGRVALASGDALMTASLIAPQDQEFAVPVPVRLLTITVPGASNTYTPEQQVHVQGRVVLASGMHKTGDGCPCALYAQIRDIANDSTSDYGFQTFENTGVLGTPYLHSFDVEWVFRAPPGPRTYQLEVGLWLRDNPANATSFPFHQRTSLSAQTFPFGPTGGITP